MAEEIYMDVPAVRNISGKFGEVGDNLHKLNNALEITITGLHAAAFVSWFSTEALAQYLENIQPYVEQYAEMCTEISSDLSVSVDAYERGDAAGATRFY